MKNTLTKFLSIGLIAIGLAACGSSTTAPLTTVGASTAGAVNLAQTGGGITFSGVTTLSTLTEWTATSSTNSVIVGAANTVATGGSIITYSPKSGYNGTLSLSGAIVGSNQFSFSGSIQLSQNDLQVIEQNLGATAIVTGMDIEVDQELGQSNSGYTGYGYSSYSGVIVQGVVNLYFNGQTQPVQLFF